MEKTANYANIKEMGQLYPINPNTERLFVRTGFIEGVATVMDSAGALVEYNTSTTEDIADTVAIVGDWKAVGDDMFTAIDQYEKSYLTENVQKTSYSSL